MIRLPKARDAWSSVHFKETLKHELETVDASLLPLQQGLKLSSYVSDEPFQVMIIHVRDDRAAIRVKAAVFYSGIVAGCNCADDPTPLNTQTEYCELLLSIDKSNAEATIELFSESPSP